MDYLQDIGSSVTGSINKAMILVRKNKENATDIGEIRDKLISSGSKSMFANPNGLLKSPERYSAVKKLVGNDCYVMQVKYNPLSIRFSSQGGTYVQSSTSNSIVNQYTQLTVTSRTTMTVDLIFDDVNVMDAFMWDKFHLSLNSAVSGTAGVVKQIAKNGYSVQQQIDGLVSLITDRYYSNVIFYWSDMAFAGEVTGVNVAYTMFNPQGNPVRGKVSLSIFQSEDSEGNNSAAYWNKAFDRLFDEYDKASEMDDSRVLDQIGNIINL